MHYLTHIYHKCNIIFLLGIAHDCDHSDACLNETIIVCNEYTDGAAAEGLSGNVDKSCDDLYQASNDKQSLISCRASAARQIKPAVAQTG